jgi:hypothetical protein
MKYVLPIALVLVFMLAINQAAHADLYGYWPLDTGSGTVAFNLGTASGVQGNGSISGASWAIDGARGNVLNFDGNDDFVDTTNAGANLIPQATYNGDFTWTIYTSLRSTESGNNDVVLGNRFGAARWAKLTPTNFEWQTSSDGGNLDIADIARNDANTAWDQHTIVKSGTSFQYYLNGVPGASTTFTGTFGTDMPFYIGGDPGGNEDVAGRIDEVGFFNEALTAGKAVAMYNLGDTAQPLGYDLLVIDEIFGVFDGETASYEDEENSLLWQVASVQDLTDAGLLGSLGQVVTDGSSFGVLLDNTDGGLLAIFTPEPASIALWSLLGVGLAGFGVYRSRRRTA